MAYIHRFGDRTLYEMPRMFMISPKILKLATRKLVGPRSVFAFLRQLIISS